MVSWKWFQIRPEHYAPSFLWGLFCVSLCGVIGERDQQKRSLDRVKFCSYLAYLSLHIEELRTCASRSCEVGALTTADSR